MAERPSIGLPTPSKEIQDAFNRISAELDKKKADWKSIKDFSEEGLKVIMEMSNKFQSPPFTVNEALLYQAMFLLQIIEIGTLKSVASLGIELSETHEHLSKLEKALNDFKLRLPK